MEDVKHVLSQWLPRLSQTDKDTLKRAIIESDGRFAYPLMHKYIDLVEPYLDILNIDSEQEPDCPASGFIFFFGCILLSMHFHDWGEHINDIFNYHLLYMLVDHFIDSVNLHPETKSKSIKQMKALVISPDLINDIEVSHDILKIITQVYLKIINGNPKIKKSLIKAFSAEIDGISVQNTEKLTREEYYQVAFNKGGSTLQVILTILGVTDEQLLNDIYHVGGIMQIIDDCIDVAADISNGINTIATHELRTTGCLDGLWIDVLTKVMDINPKFNIYKFLYSALMVYVPNQLTENYTDELREITNQYNIFDNDYQIDFSQIFVKSFMEELSIREILKLI